MAGQPHPPYPFNQDPDRTVSYRHPASGPTPGPYTQPYAHSAQPPGGPPPWQHAELGPPQPPTRKRGRGWVLAIVAAVVVALIGGGGVYAMNLLSGGGTQPEDVLPSGTMAYVRIDLDPSAGQKVALFQLAKKFSATRSAFTGDDPRKALFELLRKDSKDLAGVDYARDVEPWLGDRVGIGVLAPRAGSATPGVAVAVQVTDQTQARTGLPKLTGGEMKGLAFREDYAILAETQAEADRYAKAAPLSGEAGFAADLKALGDPGVLSFWGDAGRLTKAAEAVGVSPSSGAAALDMVKNVRFAGALRFDGGYAELTGITRGGTMRAAANAEGSRLSRLPASTVGALSVSGLGELLSKQWAQLTKAADGTSGSFSDFVAQARQSYGLALPDDLVTLLGKNVTVALDERGLDGDLPNAGAVLTTDPAKAQEIVSKLEKFAADSGTAAPQLVKVAADGRLVLANSQEYADLLAKDGTLGESETFTTAIPDADSASAALYIDLDKIEKYYLKDLQGEDRANAQALRAIGLSARQADDTTSFSLRVLFN
ncbi:DUF3352 domain-containing protein [Sphaerisporangium perillae]|uniref:DUF3352 domain-containing protein n=1 Tax=Sphaerisporangium perillae TaxID=2935860 RepID=UPI00200E26B3|nr:DUF3352 domain-containing protein [Sphaerisporangium perillae]